MRVSVENLRQEMVLSADIVDGLGRLLLPSGTVLTEKHLRYCQMWGVLEAEIEGDDAPSDEAVEVDPSQLAAVEAHLAPRFRHCDRADPVVDVIFNYCVHSQARRAAP